MKKKQMLAFGLAFALAFTAVAPSANVDAASKKAKSITFVTKKAEVTVGEKKQLKVKVKPKVAQKSAQKKLKWKTSNKKVAKISKKGVVTGVKKGKATITVTLKVGKKTLKTKCRVTVKPAVKQTVQQDVKVTEIKVPKTSVTINEKENASVEAVALPENATNKQLKYTSADENVATVNEAGVITAIAQGNTVITVTATDGSYKKAEINVIVTKKQRPRAIVTQDAEVDDMNSLIHILLYSNEIDIQGIVQSASRYHWEGVEGKENPKDNTVKNKTADFSKPYRWPGTKWMQEYLDAYAKVYPNLKKHDSSYPTPNYLRSVTKVGNIGYEGEMDNVTEGSELIKKALLDDDERTLYLMAWGGTNTIARALKDIEKEYKGTAQWNAIREKIIKKTVIPACGEQDMTYSSYIAEEWPEIKFMSCSQMSSYAYMWRTQPEDNSKATLYADYMLKNLTRNHGPLMDNYVTWGDGTYLDGEEDGSQFGTNEDLLDSLNWWGGFNPAQKYQRYDFLSEGDSPTFFMLFDTGLRTLENVTNGGFSGRYAKAQKTNSKDQELNYWSPVRDTYDEERTVESSWKYIDDIQNDFSARADWCITNSYDKANHAPSLTVEGGTDVTAAAGETVKLKAIASDPDGDYVTVKWNHYSDADTYRGEAGLTLKGAASDMVSFTVPTDAQSGDKIHLIAQAQDEGEHTLTHYQQVIVTVK